MDETWRLDMADDENLRSWVCPMPDGSELCVEQAIVPQTGVLAWRALVRLGADGDYLSVWSHRASSFSTRAQAQQAAEDHYSAKATKRESNLAALA